MPSTPRTSPPTPAHFRWWAFGMLVFAVYGSLLPFHYRPKPFEEAVAVFQKIKLYDWTFLEGRGDWVISIVLFATLGFLSMAAVCVDRSRTVGWFVAPFVAVAGIALSVAIEFLQIFFPPRTVSVNDILVESIGAILGVLIWLFGGRRIVGWLRRLMNVTTLTGLAKRLFPGYLVVILVVQLMPFDFVLDANELAVKYREGKIQWLPWTALLEGSSSEWMKAALNLASFLPLGFLAALARPNDEIMEFQPSGPWFTLAVPALVEVLQFYVYSRTSNAGDVVTGMFGVYIGWRLGLSLLRRTSWVLSAFQVLTAYPVLVAGFMFWLLMVVYVFWNPFDFTTDPSQFTTDRDDFAVVGFRRLHLAPFADYYWGSKYNALDQFARKALAFFPLGVLVALSLRDLFNRAAGVGVVLLAFAVAAVLEVGRYFLPTRTPSTTDVIIACAGAWLGFWITQRFRVVMWAESALYGWMLRPLGLQSRPRASVSRW